MRKVRLAFYKAQMNSWTDFIISGWTWIWNIGTGSYSHVEINFFIDGKWKSFSSSIQDHGTRWKDDVTKKHPDRWDVFETEYPSEQVTRMIERANSILDKKYDVLGILGFITVTGQILNNKDRWYCSEACSYVLTGAWIKRISPRKLSTRVINSWTKIKGE